MGSPKVSKFTKDKKFDAFSSVFLSDNEQDQEKARQIVPMGKEGRTYVRISSEMKKQSDGINIFENQSIKDSSDKYSESSERYSKRIRSGKNSEGEEISIFRKAMKEFEQND